MISSFTSENGLRPVAYQLSQRADFVEALVGPQTTYERPLVNARLEPLCGRWSCQRTDADVELSRLHVIFTLWEDTLVKLRGRDFPALARRLDWVLKLGLLRRAMDRRPALGWTSPEVKHLDQIYASLDEGEGLFLAYEREGLVDRVVSDSAIAYACAEPPPDTRAWTRAHLLRLAGEARIDQVDWDAVRVKLTGRFAGAWRRRQDT